MRGRMLLALLLVAGVLGWAGVASCEQLRPGVPMASADQTARQLQALQQKVADLERKDLVRTDAKLPSLPTVLQRLSDVETRLAAAEANLAKAQQDLAKVQKGQGDLSGIYAAHKHTYQTKSYGVMPAASVATAIPGTLVLFTTGSGGGSGTTNVMDTTGPQ